MKEKEKKSATTSHSLPRYFHIHIGLMIHNVCFFLFAFFLEQTQFPCENCRNLTEAELFGRQHRRNSAITKRS